MTAHRWIGLSAAAISWIIAAPVLAQDPGASTFKSGGKLYAPREWRPEDVVVPEVEAKPDVAAKGAVAPEESGPKFKISRFAVVGDTLLGLGELERTLAPFAVDEGTFATVERARNALQEHYAAAGFLTVGVSIPPQSVQDGVVELQVIEARLGEVPIENEGRKWVGDERVRSLVPHLRPGTLLRQDTLQEDLEAANRRSDLQIRPVMGAGREPGTVDLHLVVEDNLPLHGSLELHNQRTAGSPRLRAVSRLSYNNLWEREHSISLSYITAPIHHMKDLQVVSGAYSMPSPFRDGDHLALSYARSSSESGVPELPELSSIGRGVTISPRYEFALPEWHNDARGAFLAQGLSFSLDLKNVESTLLFQGLPPEDPFPDEEGAPPEKKGLLTSRDAKPIRYRPVSLEYWLEYGSPHAQTSASISLKLNRAGWLGGAEKRSFQLSRGFPEPGKPGNPVTGDFEVISWQMEHSLRLSSLLHSLGSGSWLWDKHPADRPLARDWNLVVRTFGQMTSEPLIPTEQMPGGGMRTVRGYLEAEFFGDVALGMQLELLSRPWNIALGSRSLGSARMLVFYDDMSFRNLRPAEGQPRGQRLYSFGLGLRARWSDALTSDLVFGYPLVETSNTRRNRVRLDFRVGYGF